MYKCGICGSPSKPREPLIKYVVAKPDNPKQIAREIPVCRACAQQVRMGQTIPQIQKSLRDIEQITSEALEAASAPGSFVEL